MGIRETLNKNPTLTTGGTAAVILIALIYIVWQSIFANRPSIATKAYFTVDDGATWFKDSLDKIPPYDHDGQQAVRCFVFTCDGGKTKFVGYLQRYTAQAKARLEELRSHPPTGNNPVLPDVMSGMNETEIKKPLTGDWVTESDPAKSQDIMQLKCPDGSTNNIEPVNP